MTVSTYKLLIQGRVTGVGFRYFTLQTVREIGELRGYVRNADSCTVECVLQGGDEDIMKASQRLRQGPPFAHVSDFTFTEVKDAEEYKGFQIRY